MTQKRDGQQWFGSWLPLAEAGQLEAQIAVGWEYFRGKLIAQDLGAAERWFMAAEAKRVEIGYLQLVKMLILVGDDARISEVFASRQWKTGPMVYRHALHLMRSGADDAIITSTLKAGAELGHIPSLLPLWWRDRHHERVAH